jgi:hypothetical protein
MRCADPPAQPPRAPFQTADPPLARAAVQKLRPDIDIGGIDPLARIWDEVVHRIICEMLDLSAREKAPLYINIRREMVLELAQVQLWLANQVVAKRVGDRDLTAVDPVQERRECLGPEGAGAITATARLVHEKIWAKRIEERWKPKSAKAIERDANPKRSTLSVKPVNTNHFIPRWFIRDNWAVGKNVLRWRRGETGWTSELRSFGGWGYRRNLYDDRIEAYLGLLEGDAKTPIEMLLETKPLNDPQRLSLVGFLVAQIVRSPFLIEALRRELGPILAELGHSDDPDMADKAYATLYRNHEFYNKLAHPILWSRWALVRARSPVFVLPDTFCARSDLGDGLRLIVPLTPTTCFVTLPGRETEKRIVPLHLAGDDRLARRLSSILIRSAAGEFVSHADFRLDSSIGEIGFAELLAEIETAVG